MKWVRIILKWGAVLLFGMVAGAALGQFVAYQEKVTVYSNRYALETDLIHGIEAYHDANGRFPDSLDVIKVSWLATENERRKDLLKPFYYENRGDKYVLWWPRQQL